MAIISIVRVCPECGEDHVVEGIDLAGFEAWATRKGKIQDMLPELSATDREILMTGICGDCWNAMWAEQA